MKQDDIQWFGKGKCSQKARKTGHMDITIAPSKRQGKETIRFTFRNSVHELITDSERIQYGFPNRKRNNRRLYFSAGNAENGYKLSMNGGNNDAFRYVNINKEAEVVALHPYAGDYELKNDPECNLYYIDLHS